MGKPALVWKASNDGANIRAGTMDRLQAMANFKG